MVYKLLKLSFDDFFNLMALLQNLFRQFSFKLQILLHINHVNIYGGDYEIYVTNLKIHYDFTQL